MPIDPLPFNTFDEGNDLSLNLLQQINNNMNTAYDSLVSKGRGVVGYTPLTADVNVTSTSLTSPTLIASDTYALTPGRLYRIAVDFDKIKADASTTLVKRQYVALRINSTIVRYKYFYTPKSPDLETVFIPLVESNLIECIGVVIRAGGSPTLWTAYFTTYPGCMYAQDLGDVGTVALS